MERHIRGRGRVYQFNGMGPTEGVTRSVFSARSAETDMALEQPTENELFDRVQARLDEVDYVLQEDRPMNAHDITRLDHVLNTAKQELESMRRNPMVTKQLVQSIEIKYNMLRQLLDEHMGGTIAA